MLEMVDCVLLETNDGRLHLEQAIEVFESGKLCYVDKPAGATLGETIALYRVAQEYGIPIFSSSALRYSPETVKIRNGEYGKVIGADCYSPHHPEPTHPDFGFYGIHGVETLYTVMGTGCKSVSRVHSDHGDIVSGIWEDGYVYVDKTDMVYSMTHTGKTYFLSRPRRFGKSLLVSTLKNYYLGRKELFKGLAMESLETEWKTYPVFHIDFGIGKYMNADNLYNILDDKLNGWEKQYDVEKTVDDINLRFVKILAAAHRQTGLRCVVLIDEYDKPILDVMDCSYKVEHLGVTMTLEGYNRESLRGFYSVFKAADEHLQFVLLTGVTKFSQVSVFSGFNQPDDISMSNEYASLCGITADEMFQYFDEPIREMATYYHCTYDEMVAKLKKQYDGYHFSDEMRGVFNPFSLLNAFKHQRIQDYWFRTGTPTYLVRLLQHFDENIDELTGKYYMPEQFVDYRADVEKPLPMIFQSGYLTIKDYDRDMNAFKLDFPNEEVKRGFITMLASFSSETGTVEDWKEA